MKLYICPWESLRSYENSALVYFSLSSRIYAIWQLACLIIFKFGIDKNSGGEEHLSILEGELFFFGAEKSQM